MASTEQHLCEIKQCGRPSPVTTICHECVNHIETNLNQFEPPELLRLYNIAYGVEQSADTVARKTRDDSTTPDVLNLSVYELAQDITHNHPDMLPHLAAHPDAEHHYHQILNDCTQATAHINGPGKDRTPADIAHAKQQLQQPMNAPKVAKWLQDNLNITISTGQLRQWKHRGKLNEYTPEQVLHLIP